MSKKMSGIKTLLEINAITWLTEISNKCSKEITLLNISEDDLLEKTKNYDAVWLMGVWERSKKSIQISKYWEQKNHEYKKVLSDLNPEEDIIGSAYSIHQYQGHRLLGGNKGLKRVHTFLNERGQKLILDFVPNHVGLTHPWTIEHPEYFIRASEEDYEFQGDKYRKVGDNVYAHGKDPYFPPWSDTLQMNAFSQEYRDASVERLVQFSDLCDGVRCDMAMLMVNDIFGRNWEDHVNSKPTEEYWVDVIQRVKNQNPDFKFIAEVYWDMEEDLIDQGFDYCYDKGFYDVLIGEKTQIIKEMLKRPVRIQSKLLRFIENHDEERAITKFGDNKSLAAISIIASSPSLTLVHEGQKDGYEIKTPVQLKRRPDEEKKPLLNKFYNQLIKDVCPIVRNSINYRLIAPKLEGDVTSDDFGQIKAMGAKFDMNIPKSRMNPIIINKWVSNTENEVFLCVINYSRVPSRFSIKNNDIINLSVDNAKAKLRKEDILEHNLRNKSFDVEKGSLEVELDGWGIYAFKITRS